MSLKRSLSVSLLLIFNISGAAASGSAADSRLALSPSSPSVLASQIGAILAQTYKPGEPGAAVLVKKGGQSSRLTDGRATGYGYGWMISSYEGYRLIEHGGGIMGFTSYAILQPESRRAASRP